MDANIEKGINIFNNVIKNLVDLNELGIYLAKQTDINALKTLKLMILATGSEKIDKYFNIEHIKLKNDKINNRYSENIVGNLSMNSNEFSFKLMDYIVRNYIVNFDFKCNGVYSVFDVLMYSFSKRNYFNNKINIIDERINMIEFLLLNGLLNNKQIKKLFNIYNVCVNNENNFTEDQILKMKDIVNKISRYEEINENISNRRGICKIKKEKIRDEIDVVMGISRKPNFEVYDTTSKKSLMELEEYLIDDGQFIYISEEIPRLIKQKVIK